MIVDTAKEFLINIVHDLLKLPHETESVEFKCNNQKPEEIGEYISALANTTALLDQENAYMLWGVDDSTHGIVGTDFKPHQAKVGNESLINWLLRLLSPRINFQFHELLLNNIPVVLLEINTAFSHPILFMGQAYIRIGSYKKKLKDFPEKERELWRSFDKSTFEKEIALVNISSEEVLRLLNYSAYFDLMRLPLLDRDGVLETFKAEGMISDSSSGHWNITNLGAILFAKKLSDFPHLQRKAIRVILYKGDGRFETIREVVNERGYAVGYEEIIKNIMLQTPSKEVIGQAFRREITMFPEIAIRELVANAMMHQDFHARGTSVMIEIFSHRIEMTNPGLPLVKIDRFLDSPPKTRNEALISFMRRAGICEERGSGIDKVVLETERHQLPPPVFQKTDEHTRVILFAHKPLNDMDKTEKVLACYLHASLKYTLQSFMTNTSLRERFAIEPHNSALASRIIADAIKAGLIRCRDESVGSRARTYLPWWA